MKFYHFIRVAGVVLSLLVISVLLKAFEHNGWDYVVVPVYAALIIVLVALVVACFQIGEDV